MMGKFSCTACAAAFVLLSLGGALSAQEYGSGYRLGTAGHPEAPSVRFSHHRSTELGDALDGLSLVLDAQGRLERNRSEAIINLQQAERLRLQNLVERERAKLELQKQRLELQAVKAERVRLTRQISLESQARMRPTVVISRNGSVQWIDVLRGQAFAADRQSIDTKVRQLGAARSLEERQTLLDEINFDCQELIERLAARQASLSANAYDAGRRFVVRLYDDLQAPAAVTTATLTAR